MKSNIKPIIITGLPMSGKTFLANNMALIFDKPFYLNGRDKHAFEHPFLFEGLTADNDLIIIDDIYSFTMITPWILYDEIEVNARGKKTFTLKKPQVVITIDSKLIQYDSSIMKRVKLIECENNKGIFTFKKTTN